jgi:hypothetical protein
VTQVILDETPECFPLHPAPRAVKASAGRVSRAQADGNRENRFEASHEKDREVFDPRRGIGLDVRAQRLPRAYASDISWPIFIRTS